MQGHYQTFARYNAWANIKLYGAVNELPYKEIYKQRPCAYFGSIIGTLNHILVGDRIWLCRIDGTDPGKVSLDDLVYDEFDDLQEARRTEDRRIMALVDRFEDTHLAYPNRLQEHGGRRAVDAAGSDPGAPLQSPDPSPRPGARHDQGGRRRAARHRSHLLSLEVLRSRRLMPLRAA